MVFDEDRRYCSGCGSQGYSRKTCPICSCGYCKVEGHSATNALNFKSSGAKTAKKKDTTGDKPHCPLHRRLNPTGHLSAGYEPRRSKHQRQESDKPSIAYKQPRLQQEDGQSQDEPKYESIRKYLRNICLRDTKSGTLIIQ